MIPKLSQINIITGHYGSGKTNLAVNLALSATEVGEKVRIVDLDTVNPYFRTADFTEMLSEQDIEVIVPEFANTNLDLPTLPAAVKRAFNSPDRISILDFGGDDAGAFACGQYSETIKSMHYSHFYVINARRALTQTAKEAAEIMREIEYASRIPVTALVNNTHLCSQTTTEIVRESFDFAEEVSRLTGKPIAFTSVKEDLNADFEHYPIKIYVKAPW